MNNVIYTYNVADTANNKVNLPKLDLELQGSETPNSKYVKPPYLFGGEIHFCFNTELTASELLIIDGIVTAHDGIEPPTAPYYVTERGEKISKLMLLAIHHPLLDNLDALSYLTDIDNYLNAWMRCGDNRVAVAKITEDANNISHPQHTYLNTVVNIEGQKCYEYLIAGIS